METFPYIFTNNWTSCWYKSMWNNLKSPEPLEICLVIDVSSIIRLSVQMILFPSKGYKIVFFFHAAKDKQEHYPSTGFTDYRSETSGLLWVLATKLGWADRKTNSFPTKNMRVHRFICIIYPLDCLCIMHHMGSVLADFLANISRDFLKLKWYR